MAPLGQIGKRLQIIKTAISLTDDETINAQRSKLRLQKNDAQLDTILSVLDDENYAQASNLIDRYLHGPFSEEAVDEPKIEPEKSSDALTIPIEKNSTARSQEESDLIKKFGLFMDEATQEDYNPISEEQMHQITEVKSAEYREKELSSPPQKKPNAEAILAEYETIEKEKIPQSDTMKSASLKRPDLQEKREKEEFDFAIDEISVSKGTDISHHKASTYTKEETYLKEEPEETLEEITEVLSESKESEVYEEVTLPEPIEEEMEEQEDLLNEEPMEYAPISYIDQKLRNMRNQYPQIEETTERFESEERLLYMISLEGYSEKDIEKTIDKVFSLREEGKLGEASHLLLIAAATESLHAQFMLARELYKGSILQRDLPEAFTQINRLAINDYPEAICDLAQFYENGIGIGKDKKKAFELYEDALELGVKRADIHITRMEQASRGILAKLFGK